MNLRYLALGDSYTIGTSVQPHERWPVQLARLLDGLGAGIAAPEIIATDGWTTAELAAGIASASPTGPYGLVSLLIGVNNQYRGLPLDEYRREFRALVQAAKEFAGGEASRVIVLSVPDWGMTPFARDHGRDPGTVASEIDRFNEVNREEAAAAGVRYVDVTGISRQAAADPALIADDGLHPSGKMYRAWAEVVLREARDALRI